MQNKSNLLYQLKDNNHSQLFQEIEKLIAQVLNIPEYVITDELEYRSIMEWDSMAHISLILGLEKKYEIVIEPDNRLELTSVSAIKYFFLNNTSKQSKSIIKATDKRHKVINNGPQIYRGLAGIKFDKTNTTLIDGQEGQLFYRGYSIQNLVEYSNFEETAYLLLYGELPTSDELNAFNDILINSRSISSEVLKIIHLVKDAHPIEVLRTVISALATFDAKRKDNSVEALRQRAVLLIAQIPTIVAAHQSIRYGRRPIEPNHSLAHAANFLYMLHGTTPTEQEVKLFDKVLILQADHGSNASAFTARVVAGTHSDLYAAITAAISSFAGKLHGGAIENVMSMIKEIGEPSRASEYVKHLHERKEPVMGFGHRIYQTEDPRAKQLRKEAREFSFEQGNFKSYDILEAVVKAMEPYIEKGAGINVDSYASIIYEMLRIPQDLFISTFACSRMGGWTSQAIEQYENNILIRPILHYIGKKDLCYIPIEQRKK